MLGKSQSSILIGLSTQGWLRVGGGGQHRKPRKECQGRCNKEDWVKISCWEDALGQLERWVPSMGRLLGVLGSLQWENPHRLDQNPCRLGQNQYRSLLLERINIEIKINIEASRKVFILSMFWNCCPNLCFPVLIVCQNALWSSVNLTATPAPALEIGI